VSYERGTVLTPEDLKAIAAEYEEIKVYTGIIAQPVKVSNDNVNAVLNYGSRMYAIGRITAKGEDLLNEDGELYCERYVP
ncbi:MAG: hypothetical protein Q4B44_06940, partial [Erysipelotrichaceae bacterium]|nr:hypothetical protein [Erysipelotrichaceae bacterium]